MRFGLDVPVDGPFADPGLLAELAIEAEEVGWDGFFVQEVPVLDPWVTLAAIAVGTSRIRIGAMMTPVARRRPWNLAREVATLDRLSYGRVVFGAALGNEPGEFDAVGEDPDPKVRAQKLDEGLAILDQLWRGEPVDFEGTYHRYHLGPAPLRPVQQPRVPIWTAAGWPRRRPLLRAARWDGVYLMTVNQQTRELLTPADVREVAAVIHQHRQSKRPLDIALNGEVPPGADSKDYIREFEDAGATWWIWVGLGLGLGPTTPEDYRQRIHKGPPIAE